MPKNPVFNGFANAATFCLINRLESRVKILSRFHFNEGDNRPSRNDQVDLAATSPLSAVSIFCSL